MLFSIGKVNSKNENSLKVFSVNFSSILFQIFYNLKHGEKVVEQNKEGGIFSPVLTKFTSTATV